MTSIKNTFALILTIAVALITLTIGSIMFFLYWKIEEDKGLHTEADQKGILAYLCELHDLDLDAKRYRDMVSKVSYWAESDYLSRLAIKNPKPEYANNIKQVLIDLLNYARVVEKSKGIINYDIAIIAKHQNNQKEADEHLEEAKKIIPGLIQKRLKLDPIWNT